MGSIPQLSVIKGKNIPLYPKLLHRTFEELVDKKFGQRDALIFHEANGEKRITNYNSLNSSSNRIANALLEKIQSNKLMPNRDGDWIICVCMKPSDDLITALLSIWKCGGMLLMHFFMRQSF
jgi:acyl-coenzyme A synthetase/AMP-(fatty) acid ligase